MVTSGPRLAETWPASGPPVVWSRSLGNGHSSILVDEGSSLWRIRARAQGRHAWIQRRTSHVTVVLEEL